MSEPLDPQEDCVCLDVSIGECATEIAYNLLRMEERCDVVVPAATQQPAGTDFVSVKDRNPFPQPNQPGASPSAP